MEAAAVLVPIKAFADAKVRLAPALDPSARAALARRLAAGVVAAAAPLPVAVVCDDDDVAAFAAGLGARVVHTPRRGLDGAVADGVAALAEAGYDEVLVAHADLPRPASLPTLAGRGADRLVLVPDRHLDGTNVVVLPAGCGFRFAYGAGSFARHRAEGERLGLDVEVVHHEELGWDIDVPADLDGLVER